jgi:hypothetical protein
MELILSILGAAGLGHMAADFNQRFDWMPDKPMKCNMCITFWLNCIPFILLYGWQGILYTALASIVSEFYLKQLL